MREKKKKVYNTKNKKFLLEKIRKEIEAVKEKEKAAENKKQIEE